MATKKQFTIVCTKTSWSQPDRDYDPVTGTIDELIEYHRYTLEKGASWQHESGNSKINTNPRGIKSLVKNLNNAENNAAANGSSNMSYRQVE